MIDLHNHLLPGIDDGADDLAAALAMARLAAESGTTHLVCTPHIHPGRYDNTPESIEAARRVLVEGLREAGIALQVAAAAEVRFDMEIMAGVSAGRIPFLGKWQGRDVLLLEFPHGEIPVGAERLTQWLLDHQVIPMIAHPERNKGVMRTPSRLKAFIDQGCLLQVTAGSLAGRFGERPQVLAEQLLQQDVVTVIASDAHNLQHRPPLLVEGRERSAALVGDAAAEALVRTTPWDIARQHFA